MRQETNQPPIDGRGGFIAVKPLRRACVILTAMILLSCPPFTHAQQRGANERRFSGITVKHAKITGQVFIASEDPREQDVPAKNVVVQVRIPENNEIVAETRTNDEGAYNLPRLPVGAYRLIIGSLRLMLVVEPDAPNVGERPKIIITILPKDLTRFRGA